MKKLLLLLFIPLNTFALSWSWGIKATGSHQPGGDMEIVADRDGNTVVAGYFQEELILGDFRLYTEDDYYSDIFLAGVSKDGKVRWAKKIEAGNSYENQIGLATDDDGNIYLTGAYNAYIFAAKYDSSGNEIWSTNFAYKYNGYGASIATDQFDNVYLLGGNGWSFIAVRLNYYGKVDWVRNHQVNYSAGFAINNMKVDKDGNMYFAGTFDYSPIQLGTFKIEQKGSAIWGKISPEGNFTWVKTSTGRVNNARIAITGNTLYLSGSFGTELKMGDVTLYGLCCGNPKPFIARFDTAGNQVWAKYGHTTYESKGGISDIKTDLDGNLYATGGYFTCYGVHCTEGDYFLEKYNSSGNVQWRADFNHPSGDGCPSFDFDAYGNIYNTGRTMAANFIDPYSENASNSYGIGKLATGQTTRRRISRPQAERVQYICSDNGLITLKATGVQLKWYKDATLQQRVHEGPEYTQHFTTTDTLYVTQTIGTTESLPKQVIVYKPSLDTVHIEYSKDTLSVDFDELVGYQWYYQGTKIETARHHRLIPAENGLYEVEILTGGCSRRFAFDFQRPNRPVTDSLRYVCPDEKTLTLTAEGENIVWYATSLYRDTISTGTTFQPAFKTNSIVYVRQTINGIASYPQQVKVLFSPIKDTVITKGPTLLMVSPNTRFRYQWYHNDELLTDSTYRLDVTKNGRYTVTIIDSICSRTLNTYFVKQPATATTTYFLCPGDTIPEIRVEGNNVLWLYPNYSTMRIDTVARGLSYRPTAGQAYIYVVEQENGFNSYPMLISLMRSNFKGLKINSYNTSLYLSSEYGNGYTFAWYLNNDSAPLSTRNQISNAPYGDYRLRVSFNNRCDTLIHYRHVPVYDSIQYLCSAGSPQLYVAPTILNWYSDKALTKKIHSGYYYYPSVIQRDTVFYVAQQQNSITYWTGKLELRYPDLGKLTLKQNEDKLEVTPAKSYYKYEWMHDGKILTDTSSIFKPEKDGVYWVTISAGNCSTALNHQFVRSSARPVLSNPSWRLWPNPAEDVVWIEGSSEQTVHLRLLSPNGQIVLQEQQQSLPAKINLSEVPPSVYFLEISHESGKFTEKLIKR
ncbi:MAG: T9SS type A sorting domain-containing protein [Paludibacter sp.]|jgi:hypothetical protein|nr:T9SS type A sorting domain-containing protein [Paludibacter sp.]